jgi:hypothetical protein
MSTNLLTFDHFTNVTLNTGISSQFGEGKLVEWKKALRLIGKMPVLKSALKDEKMAVLREEEKREL